MSELRSTPDDEKMGHVGMLLVVHITSRDAHLMALRDYALLIKPTITNRELRRVSSAIESDSVALKIT